MKRGLLVLILILLPHMVHARVLEAVAAFVDDYAITISELESAFQAQRAVTPEVDRLKVLDMMINRHLLLREARKLHLSATDEAELLKEYTEAKVRAYIIVKDSEVEEFYLLHREDFGPRTLSEAKGEIAEYLKQEEINRRLRVHLDELRGKSYIKVLLSQ